MLEPGPQFLEADGAILMLAAFLLTAYPEAAGMMDQPDRAVGGVDVLTAAPARAKSLYLALGQQLFSGLGDKEVRHF